MCIQLFWFYLMGVGAEGKTNSDRHTGPVHMGTAFYKYAKVFVV